MNTINLAICICTYKRPHLLCRLMNDLAMQTCLPQVLIVVDGDPASGLVQHELESIHFSNGAKRIYLPSNHPNQPYQRYLGWRIAKQQESTNILLYFDDDIHLLEDIALEKILQPFVWENRYVVGATARTISPNSQKKLLDAPALLEQRQLKTPTIVRWFGDGGKIKPGGLTATGNRIEPECIGKSYVNVECLQGRVMAFRLNELARSSFLDDLFALNHIRAGTGEDTVISHSILSKGELLLACDVLIEHPDDDLPNSYPHQAYHYGFAVAYSRRLLNDYFRWPQKAFFVDRISLLKGYLGNIVLGWTRFFLGPRRYRFMYVLGYTWGAIKGIFRPPRAKYLTPKIDWEIAAESALQNIVEIKTSAGIAMQSLGKE